MNAALKKIVWRMLGADGLVDWRRYNDGLPYDSNSVFKPRPELEIIIVLSLSRRAEYEQNYARVARQREQIRDLGSQLLLTMAESFALVTRAENTRPLLG